MRKSWEDKARDLALIRATTKELKQKRWRA